jgi:hypothetical protein
MCEIWGRRRQPILCPDGGGCYKGRYGEPRMFGLRWCFERTLYCVVRWLASTDHAIRTLALYGIDGLGAADLASLDSTKENQSGDMQPIQARNSSPR